MVGAVLTMVMLNVAVTLLSDVIDTVHVPVPVHAPLHPAKVEPAAGVAVKVAVAPLVYGDVFPDIVPAPVPFVDVVRVYVDTGISVKFAVTVLSEFIVTSHTFVLDVHPVHDENWYPVFGVAVRVTDVPLVYDVWFGDLVIEPFVAEIVRVYEVGAITLLATEKYIVALSP